LRTPARAAGQDAGSARSARATSTPPGNSPGRGARRRRQGQAAENHPATFTDLVAAVTAFADPLATGSARGHAWDPATRAWQATHNCGTGPSP
jgi:hypothetical protein